MGLGCSTGLTPRVPPGPPVGKLALLDVPYLPQSTLLCGGAAIAMVERWWGRRGVYAEDFASLVDPAAGGILTTDLESATRARGWDTEVFLSTPARVQGHLREGEPVVALIQVGRDLYHYVVVLGWADGFVVLHDPAGDPFTTVDEDTFMAQWHGADRWALVARPRPVAPAAVVAPVAEGTAPAPVPIDRTMPCPPWIDRALDAAAADRLEDAVGLLVQAERACPTESLVLRETAGIRFKQGRDPDVIRLISEYLAVVPADVYAWQLLATSRYRSGDRDGALRAWNSAGQPTLDLVRIGGLRGIRFRDLANAMSMPLGSQLTPSALALARRRASDVPALSRATLDYQPVPGGLAEVRVSVVERPKIDSPWALFAVGAIRAIAQDEIRLEVVSPTGAGELWTGNWRWESARPSGLFRLDVPTEVGFPGVLFIQGSWERFRVALDSSRTLVLEETRRSALLGFGAWVTPSLRPSADLRLERWSGNRRYLAPSLGVEFRARDDRFQLAARTEYAVTLSTAPSYMRGGARAMWASSLRLSHAAWSARLGFDWADRHSPRGTWPVAGGDPSWAVPLRAHAATSDGLLADWSVGRNVTSAGLSGDQPFYRFGPLVVAAGLFLDAARISATLDGSPRDRFYLDGGVGLRIGVDNGQMGVLRIDMSRSLVAERRSALTVGFHRSWPGFSRSYP